MRDLKKYSEEYATAEFEKYLARIRKNIVLEYLNKYCDKDSVIMEIGCGLDTIANYYHSFKELVILEPTLSFYEQCKKDIKKHTLSSRIRLSSSTAEDYHNDADVGHFDFILVSGLLNEVEEPAKIMIALKKFCKKESLLHVNVPNAESFHRLLAFEMGLINSIYEKSDTQKRLQQHHTFDKKSLAELLEYSGYRAIESGSYFIKPFTHKQLDEMIKCKLIDDRLLSGLLKLSKYFPNNGCEIFANISPNF